ncbi:MAG: HEAT repeat domain-containing protein, partial [Myxococcota bacterium]
RGVGLMRDVWDEPEDASVWHGEFEGGEILEVRWGVPAERVLPPERSPGRRAMVRARAGQAVTVTVPIPWTLDSPLRVLPAWRALGEPRVLTGDRLFDTQVALLTDPAVAARLADPAVRRWLREAVGDHGAAIDGVRLTYPIRAGGMNATRLRAVLRHALRLAAAAPALDLRGATPQTMLERATSARHEGVSGAFIDRLLADFPATTEATAAARLGVTHADPAVRLRAAVYLGPEAEPLVRGLASDPSLPQAVRLDAIKAVAAGSDRSRAVALLIARLDDPNRAIVLAAIGALTPLADPSAAAALHAVIPRRGPEVAAAARRALAALATDATEGAFSLSGTPDQAGAIGLVATEGALGRPED